MQAGSKTWLWTTPSALMTRAMGQRSSAHDDEASQARRDGVLESGVMQVGFAAIGLCTGFLVAALGASISDSIITGASVMGVLLLLALRTAQQREWAVLQRDLSELRQSIRVAHALLDSDELAEAEELEEHAEDRSRARISLDHI